MDRVSLREPYGSSNTSLSPRSQSHAWRSSQLPTPETSRSGYEPYDDDYEEEIAQSGSRRHERRLQAPQTVSTAAPYPSSKRSSSRRDSCNLRSPDSPAYRGGDSQTLSLPPLKTILADGISSPPSSPAACTRSMQPSPQEPAYTSTTYKPPALYPHKKQRTDVLLEPAPWVNRSSSNTSPGFFRSPFEPPSATHNTPKESFNGPPVALNPYLSSAPHRRSIHRYPTSPIPVDLDSKRVLQRDDSFSRRDSRAHPGSDGRYDRDLERNYDGYYTSRTNPQYELAVRQNYSERDLPPDAGRSEYYHSHTSPHLHSGPYMGGQHTLFLPTNGDYHLSKSRKRSNLPKESTDIMKQWFDQNITNPYPSEEQKAAFSNATGISMNQVSNWFINHRRRCPELRDKRERVRGRERDDR